MSTTTHGGRSALASVPVTRQAARRLAEMPGNLPETVEIPFSPLPSPSGEETTSPALDFPEPPSLGIPTPVGIAEFDMPASPYDGERLDPVVNRASTDVEDASNDPDRIKRGITIGGGRARSLDSDRSSIRNKVITYPERNMPPTEWMEARDDLSGTLNRDQIEQGSSMNKGKQVDPGNWGGAHLPSEELNIDLQKALIEAFEKGRKGGMKTKDASKEKSKH